jgi:hypothetical protein
MEAMQRLKDKLSERVFGIVDAEQVTEFLADLGRELQVSWQPVGGIPNNVHTVEVSSDPALALMERPTCSRTLRDRAYASCRGRALVRSAFGRVNGPGR